jgi:hypothetical protein
VRATRREVVPHRQSAMSGTFEAMSKRNTASILCSLLTKVGACGQGLVAGCGVSHYASGSRGSAR